MCQVLSDDMCDDTAVVIVLKTPAVTHHRALDLCVRGVCKSIHPHAHAPALATHTQTRQNERRKRVMSSIQPALRLGGRIDFISKLWEHGLFVCSKLWHLQRRCMHVVSYRKIWLAAWPVVCAASCFSATDSRSFRTLPARAHSPPTLSAQACTSFP